MALKQKTIVEEQMEKMEEKLIDDFYYGKKFDHNITVTDVLNKTVIINGSKENYEKLKGRFVLKINSNLEMGRKIEMYANDNVAFYLYKNRNFITKLK